MIQKTHKRAAKAERLLNKARGPQQAWLQKTRVNWLQVQLYLQQGNE